MELSLEFFSIMGDYKVGTDVGTSGGGGVYKMVTIGYGRRRGEEDKFVVT